MAQPESIASYTSKCPGCGETIIETDPIFLVEGDWVCENCKDGEND